ncbi:shikimate kinase [Sphingomicrobium lutaoense]|uniref:Shikimate kinase n=1 Tax=Sphingomicrobium lutaoense TaxID=515949 RepID=A0A839Z0U9_9SPHN|nr:shikimate kinase [Sphingomicrobium lutaoense]MBB3763302.1 shikimate kinase [Sphingomicrobium lutaoense]
MTHPLTTRLDRPIVLVGMMGAGKSTVGRRLAKRLGIPFIDSDSAIEDASGFTPAEVFERFGEKDFRDGERRLVARLVREGKVQVIATGGGAYIDKRTRDLLNRKTITVWLDADLDTLAQRTARPDTRPLLNGPVEERREKLQKIAQERGDSYREAHLHVRSGSGAHANVVEAIIKALTRHLGKQ